MRKSAENFGVKLHQKIKNDRGNGSSAKGCGYRLHDELAGTIGIVAVTQICRDRVNDFHFFHNLSPCKKFEPEPSDVPNGK